jgi:hypothetical protein
MTTIKDALLAERAMYVRQNKTDRVKQVDEVLKTLGHTIETEPVTEPVTEPTPVVRKRKK